jgi:hypothetical protein
VSYIDTVKRFVGLTTDPADPDLRRGFDDEPVEQGPKYLVLSDEERSRGFVRPLRTAYVHDACGTVTTMALPIAETYARQPAFYGGTYCVGCRKHLPVAEFRWVTPDGKHTDERVGS